MMNWFYLFLLSMSLLWGCTHNSEEREKYQEDVNYFFQTLRELHPDPYLRISKDSFDLLEIEILEKCNDMKNIRDINIALMECNQYFDGHTVCRTFSDFLTPTLDFPIEIRNDSIYWQLSGELVVSLDTFTSANYLQEVKKFVSYDLSPENKNIMYANYYYFCLLNNFRPPRFIDLYNPDTHTVRRQVFNRENTVSKIKKQTKIYNFNYFPKDSIAVFQYNTSMVKDFKRFQDTLQFFFDSIRKLSIQYLFIDVRKNHGGSDLVHQAIYRHLQFKENEIEYEGQWTSRGRRMVLKELLKLPQAEGHKGQVWKEIIKTYWQPNKLTEKERLSWKEHDGYDKDIFILQGINTFSAAYDFCWMMRLATPNCLLVGTNIGQCNPILGNVIGMQLPNTKIPFTVATSKTLHKHHLLQNNGFLKPDIPYNFQHEDIVLLDELKQIIKLKHSDYVQIK